MMRAAEEEEVWECLRCGEGVRSVDRFVVDNGNVSDVSGSEFEFSDIVTDLSGSVGSLSTSE
jgi:peroxin-2